MPTTLATGNAASPKQRKRQRTLKAMGSIPLNLPKSPTTVSVGVTPEAALKNLNALQSIPEQVMVRSTSATPPSGLAGVTTQGVSPSRAETSLDPIEDVEDYNDDLIQAGIQAGLKLDDEIRQVESQLAVSKRAFELRSQALNTAEAVHAKRLKMQEMQQELAISQANVHRVEADAAAFFAKTKEVEVSRVLPDPIKRPGADTVGGLGNPGDSKVPTNVTNSIILSAMNGGLSTPFGSGVDSEGKTSEGPVLLGIPKVRDVLEGVSPGVIPVTESSASQIPLPLAKVVTTPSSTNGLGPVLPATAAKVELDKFVPTLSTKADVDSLSKLASASDFIAVEAGHVAVEFADCLVSQFKSCNAVLQVRVAKCRPSSTLIKDSLSSEMRLAKITAGFCCSTLFQRMMNNPRALASLNCFLAVNRGHFGWIDETSSGSKKPPLFPFPPNLSGRDLLVLFHQFITFINGIDVVFGLSLSLLYKTADEILFVGHPPLLVAKYIDDVRQLVFSTDNVSLMWTFQDAIFTQSINAFTAIASPIPRAAIAPVIPTVVPDSLEITSRRRLKGKGRGQQGNQFDPQAETGQARTPILRPGSTDPNHKYWSCNDFNDRSGCGYPQSICKFNHICSNCAATSHGLSTHVNVASKGVTFVGEIPK